MLMPATALMALWSGPAFAASGQTATSTGAANAAIVGPITLTHTSGSKLSFGTMVANTGGTIIVTYAGASVSIGTVGLVPDAVQSVDSFTVKGDPSRNYSITTSAGTVFSGSQYMIFATSPSATQATLDTSGNGSITVGGALQVTANITPGVFTGTYNVTVAYD